MAKTKFTKFYTLSGFARIKGCVENLHYDEWFETRTEAAKFIASEINDYIDEEELDQKHVTAKDCQNGYGIYAYNDDDDKLDIDIVEHKIGPIHAVLTFDQDDRTLNITTFKDKEAAQKRVAFCAKQTVNLDPDDIEYVSVDRKGNCDIEPDELKDSEPYVQLETTGGNFIAWTAVEIPVFGTIDKDVQ